LPDIECLLNVDVGIVMTGDGRGPLADTVRQLGSTVLHISAYMQIEQSVPQTTEHVPMRVRPGIWWASNFLEILNSELFNCPLATAG